MKNTYTKQLLISIFLLLNLANIAYGASNDIQISIKNGRFLPSEIDVPADTKVKLTIENLDDTPEEFESYDLNREVLIKANSKASFYIGPLSPGVYKFEGEFSPETAQGVVRVK
jgi:hypothetical protein